MHKLSPGAPVYPFGGLEEKASKMTATNIVAYKVYNEGNFDFIVFRLGNNKNNQVSEIECLDSRMLLYYISDNDGKSKNTK